jgi:hypothetical protein
MEPNFVCGDYIIHILITSWQLLFTREKTRLEVYLEELGL